MSPSLTIFAKLFSGFLFFSLAAAIIVAWFPACAEFISRHTISWWAPIGLLIIFGVVIPKLPASWQQMATMATLGLVLLAIPIDLGILLFPRETRDAVDVRPEPMPPAPSTVLDRLRSPWSSMGAERLPAALDLARCAAAAYQTPQEWTETIPALGFADHVLVTNGSAKGIVMIQGPEAVVAFEGTNGLDDIGDWFVNLDKEPALIPAGHVHGGFLRAYNSVARQVHDALRMHRVTHVWVTGHSLGGAMAVLCAIDLIRQQEFAVRGVMTFGQPLLLEPACARVVNQLLAGRFLRFINEDDVVPRVAPGLRGGGSYVWIKDGKPKFGGPTMRALAANDDADLLANAEEEGPTPLTDQEFVQEQRKVKARLAPPTPDAPLKPQAMPNATDHQMRRYLDAVQAHFNFSTFPITQDVGPSNAGRPD